MTTFRVKVDVHSCNRPDTTTVPVAVPDEHQIRELADRLHLIACEYRGMAWGWPVYYEPELHEESADFNVPNGNGGVTVEKRLFHSPPALR